MTIRKPYKLLLLCIAALLAACTATAPLNEDIVMQRGDKVKVSGADITIQFDAVSKDISESGESYYAEFTVSVDGETDTNFLDMGEVDAIGDYYFTLNAASSDSVEIEISAEPID